MTSVIPDKLSLRACWLIYMIDKWTVTVVKFQVLILFRLLSSNEARLHMSPLLYTINVSDRIFVLNFNDSLNMDLVKD